ncbi:MAG: hypothetical protein M3R17_09335 [Bacteroidota bacterium]|nr:hypothetical protein [Bacteroidota bacterium]
MKNFLLLLFFLFPVFIIAQTVKINITLNATEGGAHANMNVTLVDTVAKTKFSGKTDVNGKVSILVPPNAVYDVQIPNYTAKKYIQVPNAPGATMNSTLFYSRDMVAQDAAFAMNASEKAEVDRFANALPDTTWFRGTDPFTNFSEAFYSNFELDLSDFDKGPLGGETVTLTGRNRHKSFKATTGANGKAMLYLPKGDIYDLSFQYHKNFESTECKYSVGTSEIKWSFSYIGTVAYLKKKKEEEDNQKREAARVVKAAQEGYSANGVAAVMDRNNFSNPLVVCDASADMGLILEELKGWFAVNAKDNPGSQFVFFNDGDQKKQAEKKAGETGGIYYTEFLPLDKLSVFIQTVIEKSTDSDSPDNCLEAIVIGMKMAKKPFGDVILIVDNHATASDMDLLSQVNRPVHVVVFCSIRGGCDQSFCQPDYLKIAWKTKGTLHINDTDYSDISKLKDGDTIVVCSTTYKLKNGEFFTL